MSRFHSMIELVRFGHDRGNSNCTGVSLVCSDSEFSKNVVSAHEKPPQVDKEITHSGIEQETQFICVILNPFQLDHTSAQSISKIQIEA